MMENFKKAENVNLLKTEKNTQDKFLSINKERILKKTEDTLGDLKQTVREDVSLADYKQQEERVHPKVPQKKESVTEENELSTFLNTEKAKILNVLKYHADIPVIEMASLNPEFREALLNFLFAGENRQITIDDDFNEITEKVIDAALEWLDALGCSPKEKTKWLQEMFTFFVIGDSFLNRKQIIELGKQNDIDYSSFFMKPQNGDKRADYENYLVSLFKNNDIKKGLKPGLIDAQKIAILKRLERKGVPMNIFKFHTPLGHPHSLNKSAHIQYSSHPELEVEAFNSIMNSVFRAADIDIKYKTDQIRTTGGGGIKGWKGFVEGSPLDKLGIPPVWWSGTFDDKTIPELQEDWKTKTDTAQKIMPLIHSQGLAKKITPSFFSELTDLFFAEYIQKQQALYEKIRKNGR